MAEGTFEEIQQLFREHPQRVAFFIGAGLSQPLFPSWKRLLEVMIEEARKSGGFDTTRRSCSICSVVTRSTSTSRMRAWMPLATQATVAC